jgi:hypothetical protein
MAKKADSSSDEIVVKHRDYQGKPTERVFSKEVHGENFADVADESRRHVGRPVYGPGSGQHQAQN